MHATHTLVISPRRYGKTSLAQKVIAELKLPASIFEFTLMSDHYTASLI
jgi:AAA+ ATPase superfamily predicted ATPase